jgi:hypothetical protein
MIDKQFAYQQRALSSTSIWLLFLFLGWSYGSMGKMGKQILYYCTIGGLGLWMIYRLFTLNSAIRKYNKEIAFECGFSNEEVFRLGLY